MVAMPAIERPLPSEEDQLLKSFLEMDTPPGFKAELIEGEIVVTSPPSGAHENAFSVLARQFFRESEIDLDVSGTKGVITPGGRFIPDGTACQVGWLKDAEPWADPTGILLVFEITSSNPTIDRGAKRRGYAAARVPCYLLVDRTDRAITLFTDPAEGDYRALIKVPFGKPLDLPAPFAFTLDTEPLA